MRSDENRTVTMEETLEVSGKNSGEKRLPFSPRSLAELENVSGSEERSNAPVHSGRSISSADISYQFDEDNNCFGFPIIHCNLFGKKRNAVFTPTPHHRAVFTYMVQTRREGMTHRQEEFASLKLLEKMDKDVKIREEVTRELLEGGAQPVGVRGVGQSLPALSRMDVEEEEESEDEEIQPLPNAHPVPPSDPDLSRKNDDRNADSRMSQSSLAKSTSNYIAQTLSNLLKSPHTDTACSFPFRDQYGVLVRGSSWGKTITPEALNSKRCFPGIYNADAYS